MTFRPTCELFINGAWLDVTSRVKRFPPRITRGRSDGASDVQPTTTQLVLDNTDGYLTPGNANSPWYLWVKRGLKCRLGVEAGTQSLDLSGLAGSHVSTPDTAALDVVGDHFGAIELQGPPIVPGGALAVDVAFKYVVAGNQRSWLARYNANQRVSLAWSTDGTLAGTVAAHTSTLGVPVRSAGSVAWAWWLDVNVAGTSHAVTFYAADTIDAILANPTGTRLGDVVAGAGVTSVFSSSAALQIGELAATTVDNFAGRVRRFQFRSGDSTGSIVANPTFYTQPVGTTTFTDSVTRVWSLAGDAAITDKQIRFLGTVDAINLEWPKATQRTDPDPGVCNAIFTLSGPLRQMQQGAKALNSTLYRTITSPQNASLVKAYWSHEDGPDSTVLASPIPGVAPMNIRGDFSLASDSRLASSLPLLNVASGENAYMSAPVPQTIPQVAGVKWEVTRFFRIDEAAAPGSATRLIAVDTNGEVATWRIFIDTANVTVSGADADGGATVLTTFASDARFFDTFAMIVLEVTDDGVNVDWAVTLLPIPGGVGFGTTGTYVGNTGVPSAIRNSLTGPPSGISVGHLIVTSGASIGWLAGADDAWVGETAAHRFYRLCGEEELGRVVVGDQGLGEGIRGDPTYSVLMGPQRASTLVDLLRECADTDGGIFYESRDSDSLAFRTRSSLENQVARVTLDEAQHGMADPFEPVLDDQRFRNDVTASRPEGSSARVVDQDSIDDQGTYDTGVEVNVIDDLHIPDHAGWRLHLGTWPEMRYPALASGLRRAGDAVVDDWLSCDLGDKATATGLMEQIAENGVVDQLIEGYDETLTFFTWDVSVTGSPAGPWQVGVRDDVKRDTSGSELAAAMTATDNAALITVTSGPLWTSTAGDFPIHLDIGGEHVIATGQTIFGGFYTFTGITRSVNGVVKSQPAGAPVKLWQPAIRALR